MKNPTTQIQGRNSLSEKLDRPTLATPVTGHDHSQGPDSAPVTLVLYGDYQCPFTANLHLAITRLQGRFDERFRYVFRHFPHFKKYPHAQLAAEAAEAAGAQGKFWAMHAYLFQRQDDFNRDCLPAACNLLELDYAWLDGDILKHVHLAHIETDVEGAKRSGVVGTPTMFFNGMMYDGDEDFESLAQYVETLLTATEEARPATRSFWGALFKK